jgi:hypothetical protein
MRNLFTTLTFRGISIAWIGLLATAAPAIVPELSNIISRRVGPEHQQDVQDVSKIILSVAGLLVGTVGAGTAIAGRIQAGGVYTPDFLPGPNRVPGVNEDRGNDNA